MHLTDEELLAEHKEEQRQKREDERLRAERRHELTMRIFSDAGTNFMAAGAGVLVGILLSVIAVKISDTDDEKIGSLTRSLGWCNEANKRLREAAK
jgi:hypothetical protein